MNQLDDTYGKCTGCGGGLPGPVPRCDDCLEHRLKERMIREQLRLEKTVDVARDIKPSKAPMQFVLDFPRALAALAYQLEFGAAKNGRGRGDWRTCYTPTADHLEPLAKAMRHILARANGEILDEDGRPHAVAALADLAIFVELEGT